MASPTKLAPFSTLLLFIIAISSPNSAAAKTFRCNSSGATCHAIVDYVSPNATTLSALRTLFTVKSLRSILGANNLPAITPGSYRVAANQTVKIPFPCICGNGTGISNGRPVYTVVPNDGLYHIAAEVFSNLVTFPEIQAANNISDPNLIEVGQNLTIPLPCSCDDVGGQAVVHYGRVVAPRESVEGIAQQYSISQDTLLQLNPLGSPPQLLAGDFLDIPLRVCSSMITNNSLDYPLLVPNSTYAVTANSCVKCKCDAAVNWMQVETLFLNFSIHSCLSKLLSVKFCLSCACFFLPSGCLVRLQCEPAGLNTSCPVVQCRGSENFFLGNTTSSGCNSTTCSYAGYNATIQTMVDTVSTCPASSPGSSATSLQGWRWNGLAIFIHAAMLCVLFV